MLQILHKCLPVLLIFCLTPLLLLTYYNQPYWDDYSNAALRHWYFSDPVNCLKLR